MTKALRLGVTALATMGVVALGSFAGCSSNDNNNSTDSGTDSAGDTISTTDSGVDSAVDAAHDTATGDTAADTASETAADTASETASEAAVDAPPADTNIHVRVAHLSPDAGAVDFCAVPTPTTGSASFTGVTPTLATDGVAGGISFKTVTGYLALPAGGYTVRVVAAGSTDCSTELVTGSTYAIPAAPGGTYVTAAAYGLKSPAGGTTGLGFTVAVLVDDVTTPLTTTGGKTAAARFFHAAAGAPAVDVGTVSGTALSIVAWSDAVYGAVATTLGSTAAAIASVDANGYVILPAGDLAVLTTLGAVATTTPPTKSPLLLSVTLTPALVAGSVYSAFAIIDGTAPQILFCDDTPTPAAPGSLVSNCAELPSATATATLRLPQH